MKIELVEAKITEEQEENVYVAELVIDTNPQEYNRPNPYEVYL